MQLRQTQDIALAEGYAAVFSLRIGVADSIKEHVDIWRQGASGGALNESEASIFALLVNQLNESFVEAYLYTSQVGGTEIAEVNAQDFAALLYQNPDARAVWNRREDSLAAFRGQLSDDSQSLSGWPEVVRDYLTELDRLKPEFDENRFVDW